MRIATNVSAIVSNNALQKSQDRLTKSIARLSSGYKINSSSDDAAGYAISEKMRLQLRGLNQADNNAADGVSVLHTAEGAMEEIQSMLARMKELSVQAANGTNSVDERSAIQSEIDSLNSEIDRISSNTEFNSQTSVVIFQDVFTLIMKVSIRLKYRIILWPEIMALPLHRMQDRQLWLVTVQLP